MAPEEFKIRIWENQNTLVYQGIISRERAVKKAISLHLKNPDRWHEIYRLDDEMGWIGFAQWKPGDCEHHAPKERCRTCNPPKKLSLEEFKKKHCDPCAKTSMRCTMCFPLMDSEFKVKDVNSEVA